jgi:peroxiredoxin
MLPLGTKLPDFKVQDVKTSGWLTPDSFKDSSFLLVIFLCKHCPYVIHVQNEIARIGKEFVPKGVAILAISSNDPGTHPDDSPENLKGMGETLGFNFPLAFDASQEAAKAFRAACTPEFYLFDKDHKLIYRGQLDDSRPKNQLPVTGKDLREALEAALSGRPPLPEQKPGIGCNIKWRPGNEPDYFLH